MPTTTDPSRRAAHGAHATADATAGAAARATHGTDATAAATTRAAGTAPSARRSRARFDRALFLAVPVIAVLLWLVLYPNLFVLLDSVREDGAFTLAHYAEFVGSRSELEALWNSIWISLGSVLLSGLIGVPLAFLFTRREFPGRRVLGALAALPVLLPPLVGVIAFLFLYGETGFFTRGVQLLLGLESAPWRLNGAWAILLVHAYTMYVYFYLFTASVSRGSTPRTPRPRPRSAPRRSRSSDASPSQCSRPRSAARRSSSS